MRKLSSGTTLVEVLVVIGLIGLIGVAGMRFFTSVNTSQKAFSQQAILQMESRKAFDQIIDQIREGTDVIRPVTGETLHYMTFRDLINQVNMLYLEPNKEESNRLKQRVYRLISYCNDFSGIYKKENEKILHNSIKQLRFTSLSPSSVQVNATVVSDKGEYQFLAHVGLLNVGGIE